MLPVIAAILAQTASSAIQKAFNPTQPQRPEDLFRDLFKNKKNALADALYAGSTWNSRIPTDPTSDQLHDIGDAGSKMGKSPILNSFLKTAGTALLAQALTPQHQDIMQYTPPSFNGRQRQFFAYG